MKFSGTVAKGLGRAANLGFPTVNIPLEDKSVSGIYAARVTADSKRHDAVAFADPARKLLEAHLLDFSDDLYGVEVEIELIKKLRDSKPFSNDEELKQMISADAEAAREALIS